MSHIYAISRDVIATFPWQRRAYAAPAFIIKIVLKRFYDMLCCYSVMLII